MSQVEYWVLDGGQKRKLSLPSKHSDWQSYYKLCIGLWMWDHKPKLCPGRKRPSVRPCLATNRLIGSWKSPEPHPEDILNGKTDTDSSLRPSVNGDGQSQSGSGSGGVSYTPTPPTLISPTSGKSSVSDVMDMARSRFEKFWGGKQEPAEKEGMV
ncbi:hypothetical protein J6590_050271 [Homalodisca vitripennis]|nr:hypothetical protein J6590_050271 [Homalodisca vitripennis]